MKRDTTDEIVFLRLLRLSIATLRCVLHVNTVQKKGGEKDVNETDSARLNCFHLAVEHGREEIME